jgi:hypothetical protein
MNIDEKIYLRHCAKKTKSWTLCDAIRNELEEHLVFIFDHKDGSETVYHYSKEKWSHKDRNIITHVMTNRQYAELLVARERKAEKLFDAWVYSNFNK